MAAQPVVYAQEALDRAWRSKRRIAAQGKSKPLKQRFMNAFGGRSAMFVDDRDFMEGTLDNVLRVRRLPSRFLMGSTSKHVCVEGRRA